jgi:hypothetical protein
MFYGYGWAWRWYIAIKWRNKKVDEDDNTQHRSFLRCCRSFGLSTTKITKPNATTTRKKKETKIVQEEKEIIIQWPNGMLLKTENVKDYFLWNNFLWINAKYFVWYHELWRISNTICSHIFTFFLCQFPFSPLYRSQAFTLSSESLLFFHFTDIAVAALLPIFYSRSFSLLRYLFLFSISLSLSLSLTHLLALLDSVEHVV